MKDGAQVVNPNPARALPFEPPEVPIIPGQRVLLVGASYSAEDIALQLVKFGAAHVTISHRTRPMEYKGWPGNVDKVILNEKLKKQSEIV